MHPILSQFRRVVNLPPRMDSHRRAAGLSTHRLPRDWRSRSNRPLRAALPAVRVSLPYFVVFLPRKSAGKIWSGPLDRHSSHRCAFRQHHLGRRRRKPRQHAFEDAIFSRTQPPLPTGSSAGDRHRPAALSALGHLVLRDHRGRSFARRRSPRDESQRPGARCRTPRAESSSESALPLQQPEFHQRAHQFRRIQSPRNVHPARRFPAPHPRPGRKSRDTAGRRALPDPRFPRRRKSSLRRAHSDGRKY